MEKARADIAAAEAKTAEYEQRMRESKLVIIRAQEARLAQAQNIRTEMLNRAREQAAAKVAKGVRDREDVQVVKTTLQTDAERLAQEMIAPSFVRSGLAQSPAGGAQ